MILADKIIGERKRLGLSQEEIDEAVNDGEFELYDGYIKLAEYSWKTENGKNYLDTRIKGEVLGEEVSPWEEISVVDGMMDLTTLRIVKDE